MIDQILCKHFERLLRSTRIVHRHLARHCVKHLQTRKLLKIRRGGRLQTRKNLNVPTLLLVQRLRHVPNHEECGRQWTLLSKTDIPNTCTLNGRLQVSRSDIHANYTARLGFPPLQHVSTTPNCELQQCAAGLDDLREEVSLDPVVKCICVLEYSVARPEIVTIVQVILKRVVGRR